MPMVATLDGEQITAWSMTDDAWAQIRATYKARDLRMTCGGRGIPKTSRRGLRFFAHYPSQDCGLHLTGPETAEHQLAKHTLAAAARAHGWEAEVEALGPSREWIADVLVSRGSERVALEVQWSPQTLVDFQSRTTRYTASGVKCVWFVGPANHRHSSDLAGSYVLHGDAGAGLSIAAPDALGSGGERIVGLADGASALFGNEFRSTAQLRTSALRVRYLPFRCWSCQGWYSRWYVGGVRGVSRCGREVRVTLGETGHARLPIEGGELVPAAGHDGEPVDGPEWGWFAQVRPEEHVLTAARKHLARAHMAPLCGYSRRSSKQVPSGYIAAICPSCGVMQGDSFFNPRFPRFRSVGIPWSETVTVRARHWCIDVGDGRCERATPAGQVFPMPHQEVWVDLV